MIRLLLLCVLIGLTLQLSSAIILRPKWYPYFRGESQGVAGSSSSQSSGQQAETLDARPARSSFQHSFSSKVYNKRPSKNIMPDCPVTMSGKECLRTLVWSFSEMIMAQFERASRRSSVYDY